MVTYSVIIATHARPVLLERALASVRAQGDGLAEIIVVSDVNCAATYRVCADRLGPADLFIQRAGVPGPARSRNLGLAACTGDFVLFLDDDDTLTPTFLSDALRHLSTADVVFSDFVSVIEDWEGDTVRPCSLTRCSLADRATEDLYVKNFIPSACLVYPRRAVAGRAFDPEMAYEDWDFLLGVLSAHPLRHIAIDGPSIHSRRTADSRGKSNDADLEAIYRAVYRKRTAPTPAIAAARQALFAAIGLPIGPDEV
jgi:GalNAc5-diNAcBac-PP-undecaprenol beta-1,3-glucosyltransferase